jgi:hypothetical protein
VLLKGFISLVLCWMTFCAIAQDKVVPLKPYTAPKSYVCFQPIDSIICDGKFGEQSWKNATWSDNFVDIEGSNKPQPYAKCKFKMLWDKKYLYVAAAMEEEHIWATLKNRDDIIFRDNDFEVFIDPDGDTHNYLEIEVNAFNTIFDLMLVRPYRNGGPMVINWDIKGLQSAVGIDGTINNPNDTDNVWTVEMAIPIASLCFHNKRSFPNAGDYWRINFSRVQWETDVVKGKYVKKKGTPEHNWVWSPQGLINMHYPEMWGFLSLSGQKIGEGTDQFTVPEHEKVKWVLRQLYYRQAKFFVKQQKYATNLTQLQLKELKLENSTYICRIKATESMYEITIPGPKGRLLWHINNEGRTWKTKNKPADE